MGSHHLMSALLLLLVASSGSRGLDEDTTEGEDSTQQLHFSSTESPSVNKWEGAVPSPSVQPLEGAAPSPSVQPLESAALASSGKPLEGAAPASTPSPSAKPLEGAASASAPSAKELEGATPASSAIPGATAVPVALEEAVTSDEPINMSSGPTVAASTETVTKDVEVHNVSLTTGLNDPPAADVATIPSRGDIVASESPEDDRDTTSPSTSHNETGKSDDEEDDSLPRDPSSTTNNPGQDTNHDGTGQDEGTKDKSKGNGSLSHAIIIGVIIFILVLLLVTMIILMLRKKKRSGSFHTQSKKNAKRDVWAGQVPELADGKAAQDPVLVENGTSGAGLETVKEEEMTTFVTGEKKEDSMVEMNELGSGGKAQANGGEKLGKEDTEEEKTPLLEDASEKAPEPEGPAEQFPAPPAEQELMPHEV